MTKQEKLIKIATYNMNGLINPIKRTKILGKMTKEGGCSAAVDPSIRE